MNIRDKVILITGANRGLGKSLVETALQQGAKKIYMTARKISTILIPNDKKLIKLQLDITDSHSIQKIADQCSDIEILINNAGKLFMGSALNEDIDHLHSEMETNLYGTINVIRALTPILLSQEKAAIVNIIGITALTSMSTIAGYSASKAALHSVTQALRIELKSKNIEVFGVYPGPIDTDMTKNMKLIKTSRQIVAQNIFDEIIQDHLDIFPDPMSKKMAAIWLANPKALEGQFG